MHAHIVLHEDINSNQLHKNLKKQGILVESAKNNYLETFQPSNILKLNTSSVDELEIEEGIKQIVKAIKKMMK